MKYNASELIKVMILDIKANKANYRCLSMILMYRVAHFFSKMRKTGLIGKIVSAPFLIIYRFITEWLFHYELPAATEIGRGLIIDHGYGIVINKHTVIGDNVRIKHGVTIGCKTLSNGGQGPSPIIGSDVDIGAGAKIIGEVRVGRGVRIGAGAVVVKDVPDDCLAVGNPCRIIHLNVQNV